MARRKTRRDFKPPIGTLRELINELQQFTEEDKPDRRCKLTVNFGGQVTSIVVEEED